MEKKQVKIHRMDMPFEIAMMFARTIPFKFKRVGWETAYLEFATMGDGTQRLCLGNMDVENNLKYPDFLEELSGEDMSKMDWLVFSWG